MLSNRFPHLIRLFAIISLSFFLASCGEGDGPTPVPAEPCPANGVVSFDSDSYPENADSALISLEDTCLGYQTVVVEVINGADTIDVDVTLEADGKGTATLNFGTTDAATSTIAIKEGDVLTLKYVDTNGVIQTDAASIRAPSSISTLGVYSETHVDPVLTYSEIINVADLGGKDTVTDEVTAVVVAPLEGGNSLRASFKASDPVSGGNFNGFAFNFGPATSGSTSLLNGTFEADDASGGNVSGATDWTTFEFVFTNSTDGPASGPVSHDAGGSQSLTMFGPFTFDSASGAYQAIDSVVPGEVYTATAYAMSWAPDPLAADNLGIMQLTFWDAPGGQAGGGNQIGPAFELLADSVDDGTNIYLAPQDGADISDWTTLSITQTAPAGTVSAEIFLLHIQLNSDPLKQAGSIFWDDVSLNIGAPVVPGDISSYEKLKFGINSAAASGLMDLELKMEDVTAGAASVFLSAYAPTSSTGDWDVYEIPLSDFTGLDKTVVTTLGFYNASSTVSAPPTGTTTLFDVTLYFDDIHFVKPGVAPPVLTGVLLNSAVEGVTFETATQSGVTNALGEFKYLSGEMVTFSIGDIVLGTVEGAPVITPVELTGGVDPVDQTATNQLVFLQSIDADADYFNGITVSAATQAAAVGQALVFTEPDFSTQVDGVVAAIQDPADPDKTVVDETTALDNFYITYTTLGGSDTFAWSFPPQYPPYPGVASFPVDFEDTGAPYYFTDFDGGVATVISNPYVSGINTSAKVAQMQKFAGETWGGSTQTLGTVDFTGRSIFTMKVWASRPVPVTLKLEGLDVEKVVSHTGSGTWEELVFDFTGLTGDGVREITLIFDNGTAGDAANDAANWTFYFDDINLQTTDPTGFELVFSDEFNVGTSPSAVNWNLETGYGPNNDGWGNNEWQLYTASPDNVKLDSGNLVITADCPTAPTCGVRDGTITSARINTLNKFEFKYGIVEARIKPPVGKGAWPAFWMLGANFPDVGWPFSGEVDVMEMHNAFSDEFTTHFTMHWCDETAQNPATPEVCFPESEGWRFISQFRTFADSLGDGFHVFSAEWDANGIVGKIDGIEYFNLAIDPGTMDEFLKEFFVILNVAMGGTLGSNNQPPDGTETWPQTMQVDYVRVYQTIGVSGATTTIDAIPAAVVADGVATSTITVQAKDGSDNNFTTSAGLVELFSTGSAVISGVNDNNDGTYTATVTNTVAEAVTITGTVAGKDITDNAVVTFTAGAVSGATTTIDAVPATVESDGVATSTITVQAKDGSGNNFTTSAGLVELFSTGSAVISGVGDNNDGTYTASVTNTVAEAVTITGTVADNAITDDAIVTFTLGAVSGATTTIDAAPASVEANGVASSTITVQAKDGSGNNFTTSAGLVELSTMSVTAVISGVNDNNDGTYTASVTNFVAEAVTITGTIAGNAITDNAIVTFTLGAVSGATTTIDVAPATVESDGVAASTITVQAKDGSGNNITTSVGLVELFSTGSAVISGVNDNNDGTYTATVTNTVAEVVTITGTVAGNAITDDAIVTFTVGAVSGATTTIDAAPATVVADGVSASTITVQAKDGSGNDFTTSAGLVELFSTGSAVISGVNDNNDGTYTATVTNTVVEAVTITGTIAGNTITDDAVVTFTVGAVSGVTTTIDATTASVVADGISASTITVQAKDGSGNNFTTSAGLVELFSTGSAVISGVNDNNDGTYTASVTNTVAEAVTITGTVAGNAIIDNATIDFIESVSGLTTTITAVPASVVNDGVASSTITVQAKDGSGNNFTTSAGLVVLSTASVTAAISGVNDNNDGTYTATVTNTAAEVVTITGTIAGKDIIDNAVVTFGPALGVYSETHINPVIAYTEIINTVTGCQETITDELSTAVAALEGSLVLSADYTSTGTGGNCNGFVFNFGPSSGSAALVNGTFETPDASAGDVGGAPGWTTFEGVFTNATDGPAFGPVSHDAGGTQSLKMFGPFTGTGAAAGAFQSVPGTAGTTYQLDAWVMNWIGDPFGNLGILQLNFLDAGGNAIGGAEVTFDPFGTSDVDLSVIQDGADISDWTGLSLSAVAPAGTVEVQAFLLHIQTGDPCCSGGSLFWDDVSLNEVVPAPVDISTYATLKFGINSTVLNESLLDLELKMEDTSTGTASIFLSNYPDRIINGDWAEYEIPMSDFVGTLGKTMVKSLGFYNASSTVSAPPTGTTTLLDGPLYFDDIHFIKQP